MPDDFEVHVLNSPETEGPIDLAAIRPGDALSYFDADGHRQTIERAGAMSPANLRRLLMRSGYRID